MKKAQCFCRSTPRPVTFSIPSLQTLSGKVKSALSGLDDGTEKQLKKLRGNFPLCSGHINKAVVTTVLLFFQGHSILRSGRKHSNLLKGSKKQHLLQQCVHDTGCSCPRLCPEMHYFMTVSFYKKKKRMCHMRSHSPISAQTLLARLNWAYMPTVSLWEGSCGVGTESHYGGKAEMKLHGPISVPIHPSPALHREGGRRWIGRKVL